MTEPDNPRQFHAEVRLDFRDVDVDWAQPVEIVAHGTFHDEWELRDPDSGVTVTGDSYLEARRRLTAFRRVYDEVDTAAQRAFDRATNRLARECIDMRVRT